MTELACIDVSNYQGPDINWHAVADSGVALAICKASEGAWYTDPTFDRNWEEAKAAGMVRGAYHFCRADRGTSPEGEADYFLASVGPTEAGDILVADIEVGDGNLSDWALRFLRHTEQRAGVRPWLYTGGWFSIGRLTDASLGDYPLWSSAYTAVMPPVYAPWSLVTMWQYTESASIPGIPERCDASWFFGDHAQLGKLGKAGAPPVVPPTLPTGPEYIMAVPHSDGQYLRVSPRLDAPHSDFVPNGEHLKATTALQPSWTSHWRAVARAKGNGGYALAANLVLPD